MPNLANVEVALLAVGATFLFLRARSLAFKIIFGLVWLLLLPNTAYLFTDLGHMLHEWSLTTSASRHMVLLAQYLLLEVLGVAMFLFSFLPFEKITDRVQALKKKQVFWLVLFNFLVAFGMVLGRFQHINSWVVFARPGSVLASATGIFTSTTLFSMVLFHRIRKHLRAFRF